MTWLRTQFWLMTVVPGAEVRSRGTEARSHQQENPKPTALNQILAGSATVVQSMSSGTGDIARMHRGVEPRFPGCGSQDYGMASRFTYQKTFRARCVSKG